MANTMFMFRDAPIFDYNEVLNRILRYGGGNIVMTVPVSNSGLVVCMEKYFFRNDNYAAVTIVFDNINNGNRVSIVGYGGGDGVLNISFGANYDYARGIADILCSNYGYHYCN